ncbi:inorganic pyrophosphatase [Aspergillus alliaceus]|uniref:inorganic diphosphatase n=1 Tax=Petromyces alliaceus TaxID=209559 RepID=A0A5N7CKT0_PETAA|nr:inorganic pyrophosphatase [Aspergillus alliaceus]
MCNDIPQCEPEGDCLLFERNGQALSPWKDIPLFPDCEIQIINMIFEMHQKKPCAMEELHNPIKDDAVQSKRRHILIWESPDEIDAQTGIPGDDDPQLGALAVIDEGQTDWKIIAIDVNDRIASKLSDVNDKWYQRYKVPEGKKENIIALGGELKTLHFALGLIEWCHVSWQEYSKGLSVRNLGYGFLK